MQFAMALMPPAMFQHLYRIARIARLFGINPHRRLNKGNRTIHRLLLLIK